MTRRRLSESFPDFWFGLAVLAVWGVLVGLAIGYLTVRWGW